MLLLVLFTGCVSIQKAVQRLPATTPGVPHSDKELLVSLAIKRAVVDERDITDYNLLPNKGKIIVSSVTMPLTVRDTGHRDILSAGALPATDSVQFVLLSPAELQRLADKIGSFVYLQPGSIAVEGDTAKVELGTTWKSKQGSRVVYLSGGGYQLQYVHKQGQWYFDRALSSWEY